MPEREHNYESWLQDFESEVASALGTSGRGAAAKAAADFEDWWRGEHGADEGPDGPIAAEVFDKELELARKEIGLLKEELARAKSDPDGAAAAEAKHKLEKIGVERQELLEKISRLEDELKHLRAAQARTQGTYAEMRVKMSRAKDEYEGQIHRLEDKVRMLGEQLTAMEQNKAFLQREYETRGRQLECEKGEREQAQARAASAEKIRLELEAQLKDVEKGLGRAREEQAAARAQIGELREQCAHLQERLVRGSDEIDRKLAASRREFELAAKSAEGGGKDFEQRQAAAEARMLEAMRYLENKVREVQLDNKERFEEFRDLLDTLSRFRKGQ